SVASFLLRKYGRRLGGLLDRDAVAKRLELADRPPDRAVAVTEREVLRAEFLIRRGVAHDIQRDFEHLMADGDDRLFVPSLTLDAPVARLQGRPFRARRRQRTFNQRATQIAIALARLALAALARRLVQARTHGAPAAEMGRRGKARHINAGFREDGRRSPP